MTRICTAYLEIPHFSTGKSVLQAGSSPASAVGRARLRLGWSFLFLPRVSPPLSAQASISTTRGSAIPAQAPQHPTIPGHVFRHAGSLPWLCFTVLFQENFRKPKLNSRIFLKTQNVSDRDSKGSPTSRENLVYLGIAQIMI